MTDPRPQSSVRARGCAALLIVLGWTGVAVAAGPVAHGPTATQGDCDHLLRQFDVAWAAHRDLPRAAGAKRSRDLGEAACRDGHYADGVHALRRALHDIGLKPVKRVPTR